jgi:hypothetical protein
MIGELVVHFRHIYLLHMAGGAIPGCHWAGCAGMFRPWFLARRIHMALQAGVVIGGRLRLELLVRIMTGDTGDPGVAFFAPALAGNKPVWRGSGSRDSLYA